MLRCWGRGEGENAPSAQKKRKTREERGERRGGEREKRERNGEERRRGGKRAGGKTAGKREAEEYMGKEQKRETHTNKTLSKLFDSLFQEQAKERKRRQASTTPHSPEWR